MQVVLEINNPNDLQLLLQYVKLLSSARVLEAKPPTKPASEKKSFFERHYGVLSSRMTAEEIDAQLIKLRGEWERDTW
ncbi:MAG: hypothetical protein Q7T20_14240 [Saprospiraceae bacterium]|nr:hypothetical protein [Saprospiraceae bacterium]